MPQRLYHAALRDDFGQAVDRHLFECIECGLCAYVCPSHIPLVRYFRYAKTQINNQERQLQTAQDLRERFLAKQQRDRQEAQSSPSAPEAAQDDKRAYLKEAISRSRSRRERIRHQHDPDEGHGDD
jgi:electron transport complex protein RnfC